VDERFRVLFVCTGNVCRSPFAEILTRHLLRARLGQAASRFVVASAGVQGVAGAGMHPDSRAELAPWGLHGAASGTFVARRLDASMVDAADLVLGAGQRHRRSVVECSPAGLGTTFAVREFARLAAAVDPAVLPADPVERAHALVDHTRHGRGLAPPAGPDADRVPDPIGGPRQAHHAAAVLLAEALETVVSVITPGHLQTVVLSRPAVRRWAGEPQLRDETERER
jgi:protein-tyrosine phosphatase